MDDTDNKEMKIDVSRVIEDSGKTDMFTLSVRLTPETHQGLLEIIKTEREKKRRVSLNSLIGSILKNFIRQYKGE